jgi:hypothetical protein
MSKKKKKKGYLFLSPTLYEPGYQLDRLREVADRLDTCLHVVRDAWICWIRFRDKHDFNKLNPENVADHPELRLQHADVDRIADLDGFASAFVAIGWLQEVGGIICSSKAVLNYRRMAEARAAARQSVQGGHR